MPQLLSVFAYLTRSQKIPDLDQETGNIETDDNKCPTVAQKNTQVAQKLYKLPKKVKK